MRGSADEPVHRTDGELLRSAVRDPAPFGLFYDRHVEAILRYCHRRTGCPETAADLTAEVFAAAFVKRSSFRDDGGSARPWLFGIASRQLGKYARRERVSTKYRHRLGMGELDLSTAAVERLEELLDLEPLRRELADALMTLPRTQVAAIQLRVVDDLSYAEVAARLGCTEGAARVRVCRGLTALADLIEPHWNGATDV
jgi:RNA polymerase sigma-70 factor, ECF subfamily